MGERTFSSAFWCRRERTSKSESCGGAAAAEAARLVESLLSLP
jgi:hypothetical protein